MIGRVLQQWMWGAAGQDGVPSRDFAAPLREVGLPVARLQTLKLAEGSEEARCVEAFLDELTEHGVHTAIDRVIWAGVSRTAFLGALQVMQAGMLPGSIVKGEVVLSWLDAMMSCGRESCIALGGIDLAERFYLLAHAGRGPGQRLQLAFFAALCAGRADKVAPLCEAGADPNQPQARDTTPMCYAVRHGRPQVLGPLVEAGADPNLAGPDGHTPLSLAVSLAAIECLFELKKVGADFERRHAGGQTVLHQAVAQGDVGVVSTLLALGASVSARCRAGWTPLHIAAYCGLDDMLVALLSVGADPMSRDAASRLPIHFAAEQGFAGVVQLLAHAAPISVSIPDRQGITARSLALHGRHMLAASVLPTRAQKPLVAVCSPTVEFGDALDENLRF